MPDVPFGQLPYLSGGNGIAYGRCAAESLWALADGATGRAYVGAAVGLNVPAPSAAASAPVPAARRCVPVPVAADLPSRAPRRRLPPELGYHVRAWKRK